MTSANAPKGKGRSEAQQQYIKKAIRSVPDQFVMCRVFLHAWDYTTVTQKGRELIQGLQCLRCGTIRYVKIDGRTGERKGNTYDYPDGYVLSEGGPLTAKERAVARLGEVKRHIV